MKNYTLYNTQMQLKNKFLIQMLMLRMEIVKTKILKLINIQASHHLQIKTLNYLKTNKL